MLTSTVQLDDRNELLLSVSGLNPDEMDELREWFSYTKPIGPTIRVVAHASSGHAGFCVVATGNEPGAGETLSAVELWPPEAVSE
jgi:hypothetical protein